MQNPLNLKYNIEDFQILEFISKGRFGSVWKVQCNKTQNIFALKAISKEYILKHRQYQNLKREVELHSRMEHKHISTLQGYFHDDFFSYLLLDYYPNTNLYYYTKKFHPIPEIDVARFFLQIVSALDYMHKRNIIHRDIKLENLFLDENFNVKLGDFGYSVHTLGQRDTYCGTLSYMTIEQIERKQYGKEVDIWSLGVVLYEIKFKVSPFLGQSDHETIENIKNSTLKFPEQQEIDPNLKDLIRKLLEPNPQLRITLNEILHHDWVEKYTSQFF